MEKWINEVIVGVVASMFMLGGWFVRVVLTSARKIELLEAEIAERDHRRAEDREALIEIRRESADLRKEIKQELKDLREEMHRLIIK